MHMFTIAKYVHFSNKYNHPLKIKQNESKQKRNTKYTRNQTRSIGADENQTKPISIASNKINQTQTKSTKSEQNQPNSNIIINFKNNQPQINIGKTHKIKPNQ